VQKQTHTDDPRDRRKSCLARLAKWAVLALPLITAACASPVPPETAVVSAHTRDATMAQTDPAWTWADRYYFTS
jgi:hypothetical protein